MAARPRGIGPLLGSFKTPKTPPRVLLSDLSADAEEELLGVEALGAEMSAIGAPWSARERFFPCAIFGWLCRRGG